MRLRHISLVITAAAGPLSNLIVAFISALVVGAVEKFAPVGSVTEYISLAFVMLVQINVLLAVFNLIPLPPLDGWRIAAGILPDKIYFKLFKYDNIIRNALMGFLLLSMLLNRFGIDLLFPMRWLESAIAKGMLQLSFLIFGIQ